MRGSPRKNTADFDFADSKQPDQMLGIKLVAEPRTETKERERAGNASNTVGGRADTFIGSSVLDWRIR